MPTATDIRSTRLTRLALSVASVALTVACAASPTAPSPVNIDSGMASATSATSATVGLESNLSFCTEEINRYRATVGLPALARSMDLDSFAGQAAEHDARLGVPHEYFRKTNGGGVARAENQLLKWRGYGVNEVIRRGVAEMWAEGPTGSHYKVLTGNYTQVGCGVFMNGSEVSISQDFR